MKSWMSQWHSLRKSKKRKWKNFKRDQWPSKKVSKRGRRKRRMMTHRQIKTLTIYWMSWRRKIIWRRRKLTCWWTSSWLRREMGKAWLSQMEEFLWLTCTRRSERRRRGWMLSWLRRRRTSRRMNLSLLAIAKWVTTQTRANKALPRTNTSSNPTQPPTLLINASRLTPCRSRAPSKSLKRTWSRHRPLLN